MPGTADGRAQAPRNALTLEFTDPVVEREFVRRQERDSSPLIARHAAVSLVIWTALLVAVWVLAPDHRVDALLWVVCLIIPIQLPLLVLAPRAETSAECRRIQRHALLAHAVDAAVLVALVHVQLRQPAAAVALLVGTTAFAAACCRHRAVHVALLAAGVTLLYQAVLAWQWGMDDASTATTALVSLAAWAAGVQAVLAARNSETALRDAFGQERLVETRGEERDAEKERADRLLLNAVPAGVARRLRTGPGTRTVAVDQASASLLVADLSGFTAGGGPMTAADVVETLNAVFAAFDDIVEKHGMERLRTVGDCYVVAAGVTQPRADHAPVLTGLALELRDQVLAREFAGRKLPLRLGLHAGKVSAGIIGRGRFVYDTWGDAVKVAGAMASLAEPGTLYASGPAHDLLAGAFDCESRGVLAVKGHAELALWLVRGPAARTTAAPG
ncbi:MAG: adenylate/guanylate cyclase domain-containing protein [Deltaproteobacteria bacterium]|nr:adenylate/guanylate cyclase domain-containing protein [Deltaproteobacteria bacterium]